MTSPSNSSAPIRRSVVAALLLTLPAMPALALSTREAAEMRQLAPTDRMIQVCFLKLEDRLSRETSYKRVDRVVLDAFSRGKIEDRTVRGKGAAFRNKGNWFRLRFRCSVTADRMHVEDLHYTVLSQTPIARSEWERHWLFP